jgi:hypothetical protein
VSAKDSDTISQHQDSNTKPKANTATKKKQKLWNRSEPERKKIKKAALRVSNKSPASWESKAINSLLSNVFVVFCSLWRVGLLEVLIAMKCPRKVVKHNAKVINFN